MAPDNPLILGEPRRLKLILAKVEADVRLEEREDCYELRLSLDAPGDLDLPPIRWDEKEIAARLGFENGEYHRGYVRGEEGLTWAGCLHGWSTKVVLIFARPESGSRVRSLDLKVLQSYRRLNIKV